MLAFSNPSTPFGLASSMHFTLFFVFMFYLNYNWAYRKFLVIYLSIMTLSIMTLTIMTLTIMTLRIMTLSIMYTRRNVRSAI